MASAPRFCKPCNCGNHSVLTVWESAGLWGSAPRYDCPRHTAISTKSEQSDFETA